VDADEEEKKTFNSSYEIVVDYSEYSTIQGLIYIFFSYQTLFGKIFWIIVILSMLALGLYWCIQAYLDWQKNPVLTTITTTAYSVKQVKLLDVAREGNLKVDNNTLSICTVPKTKYKICIFQTELNTVPILFHLK